MKTKFADDANDTNDTKTKPKRKQSSGAIAWYVIILFNLTSIFGMVITLFFSLYFAASDCYFFLILAVLGILYYAWIVYRILIPTGYVPVIRIKGKEKSLWGVIIIVSFFVLIAYFLIGGATIIFECLAHSELSRRIFNAVCSMRVFLWITSICGNILIVAMVEREVEIRQALAIKHRSKDNLTRFSKYSVRRNAIFTKKTAFLRGFGNELCITSC